jgi:putative ABC transport system substrate-binding protein
VLVVNLETAKALGLTMAVAAAADRSGDRVMSRRRFIASSFVAAASSLTPNARVRLTAWAQPAVARKTTRVGVLYPGGDNDVFRRNFAGFRQGLESAGYVEGRNLGLDIRFGDGRALAPLAAELTQIHPDLLHAVARPGVLALHAATSTIPIVAIDLESDPVASGFVKTLARPAGNITGVFMDFPDLAGKWLEILKTIVPTLTRVAVLWDPATGPAQLAAAQRAAQVLKVSVFPVEAASTANIERAVQAATRERANGMIVLTSPIFNTGRRTLAMATQRHRLPTLLPFPGYTADGGLVSYGPDVRTMYGQVASLAVKILDGRPAGEVPIERPTTFTMSCNLTAARALGVTIPPSVLARSDEIIE